MITIEQLESFLWEQFGKRHALALPGGDGWLNVQDLGPALADWLHERGVSIDWSDGSRFGTPILT